MAEVLPAEDNVGSPLLVQLGGKDLFLSPMNLDIMGTVKRQAKELAYKEARERLEFLVQAGIDTPENKKEVCFGVFRGLDDGSAVSDYFNSPEGTVEMVWMMLLLRHPDLEKTFVAKNIGFADIKAWHRKADRATFPHLHSEPVTTDEDVDAALKETKIKVDPIKPEGEAPDPNGQAPEAQQSQPGQTSAEPRLTLREVSTS